MIELVFIRHGATAGNLERRYIGRTDEPLCESGVAQAQAISRLFRVDKLFASPMLRTRQTAQIVFPGMEAVFLEEMRETDFGVFEGKTADELQGNSDYVNWIGSMCLDPIPEGERVQYFKDRCCKCFLETVENIPDGSAVAFVVHGGVIMAVLERFAVPKRDFYDYHIKNGQFIRCEYENGIIKTASE